MTSVLARYEELLAAQELRPDADQRAAVEHLDRVQSQLEAGSARKGLLAGLLGRKPDPVRGLCLLYTSPSPRDS